jgi:hypothetical protein
LDWLMAQKDPNLDRIEELDAETMLDLIEREQHVAVYFCKTALFFIVNDVIYFGILYLIEFN